MTVWIVTHVSSKPGITWPISETCRPKRQFPSVMSIPHLLRTRSTARQLFRTEFDCYIGTFLRKCWEVLNGFMVTVQNIQCPQHQNEPLDSAIFCANFKEPFDQSIVHQMYLEHVCLLRLARWMSQLLQTQSFAAQ